MVDTYDVLTDILGPFWATRRTTDGDGRPQLIVAPAVKEVSVPAAWLCHELGITTLNLTNEPHPLEGIAHVLTNWPRALIDRYAAGNFFFKDDLAERYRVRLGWTEPETIAVWADENPGIAEKMSLRREFDLPVPYVYCFEVNGALPFMSIARQSRLSENEKRVIEFFAPCLFRLFLEHVQGEALRSVTRREREVLQLSAAGLSTQEIAEVLDVSDHTVVAHVRNACSKLGTTKRLHAVALALRFGLIDSFDPDRFEKRRSRSA